MKLSEVGVAALNGKIYVLGGSTPDRVDQPLNQEYDPATDRWRERAPWPRGLTHAGITALNGKIYVVGAFTASGHRRGRRMPRQTRLCVQRVAFFPLPTILNSSNEGLTEFSWLSFVYHGG